VPRDIGVSGNGEAVTDIRINQSSHTFQRAVFSPALEISYYS